MIPAFHPIQSQHLLINLMLSKDNILPKLELGGFYYVSTKEKNYREEPIFICSVCSNKRIQENYSLTPSSKEHTELSFQGRTPYVF